MGFPGVEQELEQELEQEQEQEQELEQEQKQEQEQEQELEHAEALMKWPSEKEGSLHSDSEWDNSDSELSDQDELKLNVPEK